MHGAGARGVRRRAWQARGAGTAAGAQARGARAAQALGAAWARGLARVVHLVHLPVFGPV